MNMLNRTQATLDRSNTIALITKAAKIGTVVLFGLIAACSAYNTVDTGNVGVKRTFREASAEPLNPGLHWTIPFVQDIVEMNVQTQKWADKGSAYTRDVQQATIQFSLNYGLDRRVAVQTFQEVGVEWQNKLVGQVVHESMESVFGQYNAVDIVSKREQVSRQIESMIRTKLAPRGVLVPNFQVTNIDFEPAFEKSVEAKVIAEQDAIREKNATVQVEEKARQQVATAKGNAEATVLNAKAEAEAIRIKTEALEKNDKLIELVKAEKWNGVLPVTVLGSAPVPFMNVGEK